MLKEESGGHTAYKFRWLFQGVLFPSSEAIHLAPFWHGSSLNHQQVCKCSYVVTCGLSRMYYCTCSSKLFLNDQLFVKSKPFPCRASKGLVVNGGHVHAKFLVSEFGYVCSTLFWKYVVNYFKDKCIFLQALPYSKAADSILVKLFRQMLCMGNFTRWCFWKRSVCGKQVL